MARIEYIVADKYFRSQKELENYIKNILHKYNLNEFLDEYDFEFMMDLLVRHPKADEKIGCGIDGIRVVPEWGNRRFDILRLDDSSIDFSPKKCLTPETQLTKFKRACRNAIQEQVRAFKNQFFAQGEKFECPINREVITYDNAHVDHEYPNTFDQIVHNFIKEKNIDVDSVAIEGEIAKKFKDKKLEEEFAEYHKANAKLRVISKSANLRQPKAKGLWKKMNYKEQRDNKHTQLVELLEKVQFVVDAGGNKSAVQLSVEVWEELLTILEDLEDAEEIRLARENKEEAIPWEQAKAELGIEV